MLLSQWIFGVCWLDRPCLIQARHGIFEELLRNQPDLFGIANIELNGTFTCLFHDASRIFFGGPKDSPHAFLCRTTLQFKKPLAETQCVWPYFLGLIHEELGLACGIKGPLVIRQQ